MAEDLELDLTWRPTEEEYVSPLDAAQWAELLGDAAFCESDAGRAVQCLHEYGEPATFQQLSIRFRGTMGRYRRWLSEAAQAAGERFGVSAPQQDQYGTDEWWPLLYQTRPGGKPGSNQIEMQLRDEVEEAFELLAEREREERRAENVRNLRRIEQIERARQQERERMASEMATQVGEDVEAVASAGESDVPESSEAPITAAAAVASGEVVVHPRWEALSRALTEAAAPAVPSPSVAPLDMAATVDYALRYAERLRYALVRMQEGVADLSCALVARTVGDESVETLQNILNGEVIPPFAYIDKLCDLLFIDPRRLEARDGDEEGLPVFCSLVELMGPEGAIRLLDTDESWELFAVKSNSDANEGLVVVSFGPLRCTLLSRASLPLEAFEGLPVVELVADPALCENLAVGNIWPGVVLG